jgi:hypothetical protein
MGPSVSFREDLCGKYGGIVGNFDEVEAIADDLRCLAEMTA